MSLEAMDSHQMQIFKTIAQKLLVLAKAKFWPASLRLTLFGDLTWTLKKSERRFKRYKEEATENLVTLRLTVFLS